MITEVQVRTPRSLDELRDRLGDSRGVERALERFLDSTAMAAQSFAELNAPKDTRRLVQKIGRDKADRQVSGAVQSRVGVGAVDKLAGGAAGPLNKNVSKYPLWVHEGTGLFGAYHRRVTPVRAKRMRFFGKTGLVLAASTRGQRPQPYIGDAFVEINTIIPEMIPRLVEDVLDGRV